MKLKGRAALAIKRSHGTARRGRWAGSSSACFIGCMPNPLVPGTRTLKRQQFAPHYEQIRERRRHFQAVQVLREPPIAHFLKPEDALDHTDRVLDLDAHPRLVAVLRLDRFIDPAAKAITTVRAVPSPRSNRTDRVRLTLIGLRSE